LNYSGGTYYKEVQFSVRVEKYNEKFIMIKEITIASRDPRLKVKDIEKLGIIGEYFVIRKVTLIMYGRCIQQQKSFAKLGL